ncbi:MAG: hypothetical protein JNJ73_00065 [Hyphomonadaceae bacterium]|nr:hypothetical protein [Hyphomonadaceae bacterium]
MSIAAAEILWTLAALYLGAGLLVAIPLLFGGAIGRFDRQAASAPLHVKLLLAPGLIALWPLMLQKARADRP